MSVKTNGVDKFFADTCTELLPALIHADVILLLDNAVSWIETLHKYDAGTYIFRTEQTICVAGCPDRRVR